MSNLIQLTLQRRKLFKTINLESLHDPNLSWKAKAIHIYLMSRPDGWKLNYSDLVSRSTEQRVSVKNALRELKDHGYLMIRPHQTAKGKLSGSEWWVTESPGDLPINAPKPSGTSTDSQVTRKAGDQQGSKGGLRETEVKQKEGTSFRPEINFGPEKKKNEADAELDQTPVIRKSTTFPAQWYKQALSVYQHVKNLTLSGPEYDPLYHELKTIFLAGHHITEVTGMMWWLHNQKWPNWRLSTIRLRMAEWKAGQLQSPKQIEQRSPRAKKQSLDDAKDELQSFVNAEEVTHASG